MPSHPHDLDITDLSPDEKRTELSKWRDVASQSAWAARANGELQSKVTARSTAKTHGHRTPVRLRDSCEEAKSRNPSRPSQRLQHLQAAA
ncbi:hypothetical protein Q7P37_006588 [Cladosporium fusiforme]